MTALYTQGAYENGDLHPAQVGPLADSSRTRTIVCQQDLPVPRGCAELVITTGRRPRQPQTRTHPCRSGARHPVSVEPVEPARGALKRLGKHDFRVQLGQTCLRAWSPLWRARHATGPVEDLNGRVRKPEAGRTPQSEPDWGLLRCEHAAELPALRWKLTNLATFRDRRPADFERQAGLLAEQLGVA